jgi:multiple sugar transport system substrate-binding protein
MAQAGGTMVSADGKTATVDSAENAAGLQYVQDHLVDGTFAYASDIGMGWGGEAFGKNAAAMTIEGNWISGAMNADFKDVKWKAVELPAGPKGQATLQFSNCWGIAADSANQAAAVDLVKFLTSPDQQIAFADAFGVMPSNQAAGTQYQTKFPAMAAFSSSAKFAQNPLSVNGASAVLTDFNAKLANLKTTDPKTILASVQSSLADVLKG